MAFTIPTISTVIARIQGDITAAMGSPNALLKRSVAWLLAHALGGAVWGLYLYQSYIADAAIPDTATGAELARWAAVWVGGRVAATKATGGIVVYGIAGSSVSAGAQVRRSDGVLYVVTGGPYAYAVSGTQNLTVEAVTAGVDGNATYDSAARLEFVSPPAGIRASNPMLAAFVGGADEEADESYRARMLARIQDPPQGGSVADWESWTQAALATVDRVWVQAWPDVADGTVTVYFTVDGSGTGVIPSAGNVTTVQTYIEDTSRKPVAVTVTAAAPTGQAITLTIGSLVIESGYVLADVRTAIVAEVEEMFREVAEVLAAGSTIPNSSVHEAIGRTPGVVSYSLSSVNGGSGTASISVLANRYPTIVAGGVTWT